MVVQIDRERKDDADAKHWMERRFEPVACER